MQSMARHRPGESHFPNFQDGDVEISLSDDQQDRLLLHGKVLANASQFFEASLEKEHFSHNKIMPPTAGDERQIKRLYLDFKDRKELPFLLGCRTVPVESLRADIVSYDDGLAEAIDHEDMTIRRYHSRTVIAAYKVIFALLYNLRVELDFRKGMGVWSRFERNVLVPVATEIADAYGLLCSLRERLHGLCFGHKWNGYDLIAAQPFHFLRAAKKLQSVEMYQEAMLHAVAIGTYGADSRRPFDELFFARVNEDEIQHQVDRHTCKFRADLQKNLNVLLTYRPDLHTVSKRETDIGVAIFRAWVTLRLTDHDVFVELQQRSYHITELIDHWADKFWVRMAGICYWHVRSVVERCFEMGVNKMEEFESKSAKCKGVRKAGSWADKTYITGLDFEGGAFGHNYPWDDTMTGRYSSSG